MYSQGHYCKQNHLSRCSNSGFGCLNCARFNPHLSLKTSSKCCLKYQHSNLQSPKPQCNFDLIDEQQQFSWSKQWYPVYVLMHLDTKKPTKVQLLGKNLVVWRDGENIWQCIEDGCTKISQPGRETGEQQFRNKKSDIKVFPTQEKYGLLWVWGESGENAPLESRLENLKVPPEIEKTVTDQKFWHMADVPYDYQFLMENLLDPSHVPFAHYGTLSNRKKAKPLYQKIETDSQNGFFVYQYNDFSELQKSYQGTADKINGSNFQNFKQIEENDEQIIIQRNNIIEDFSQQKISSLETRNQCLSQQKQQSQNQKCAQYSNTLQIYKSKENNKQDKQIDSRNLYKEMLKNEDFYSENNLSYSRFIAPCAISLKILTPILDVRFVFFGVPTMPGRARLFSYLAALDLETGEKAPFFFRFFTKMDFSSQ